MVPTETWEVLSNDDPNMQFGTIAQNKSERAWLSAEFTSGARAGPPINPAGGGR